MAVINTVSGGMSKIIDESIIEVETQINNHITNKSNPHGVTKSQIGLAMVDNTSDSGKPVSEAQQEALDKKQNNLGFMPVQQGGGAGQLSNKIYIGWSGFKPKLQVDNADQGYIAMEPWVSNELNRKSNIGHEHTKIINEVNGLKEVGIMLISDAYYLRPVATNFAIALGGASARYDTVYLKTSPNVSSDINLKRDVARIADDERYLALFDEIEPYSFGFKDGDRIHTGFISQYVEEALAKVGLTAEECAFFCKDLLVEEVLDGDGNRTYDGNGELITRQIYNDDGTPKYVYSLRLEEYIGIMTAKIKQVESRNTELKSVCQSLEERIIKLEKMI